MLGRMAGGVTERREASFDRTGTVVSPSPMLAPPKLFLADDSSVSGVSPPAPVEAAIMSPTSTLPAAAGSPTSRPAATAAPFFSRHGASSSSSRGDCRCKSTSRSRHHRPAWEAAGHAGLGLAGALNGGDAGVPPAATVLTGRSLLSAALSLMMSPREMEASEAYTRVVAHAGSSPRTTHIFDGRVVAVDGRDRFSVSVGAGGEDGDEFLRWCHGCSKDLGQGKDIFMYRGEMAFCSHECRYREMLLLGEES